MMRRLESALADAEVRRDSEAMIEQYGAKAPMRAVERLNARIEAGDTKGRDHWA
jgi:hypothetical protein